MAVSLAWLSVVCENINLILAKKNDFVHFHLKDLTMHSIFEVKHSIEEPRILFFTTQTPRIGDNELKQRMCTNKQSTKIVRNLT